MNITIIGMISKFNILINFCYIKLFKKTNKTEVNHKRTFHCQFAEEVVENHNQQTSYIIWLMFICWK